MDNNNCGEQEETLSDEVKAEDEDFMSNAIYQVLPAKYSVQDQN